MSLRRVLSWCVLWMASPERRATRGPGLGHCPLQRPTPQARRRADAPRSAASCFRGAMVNGRTDGRACADGGDRG